MLEKCQTNIRLALKEFQPSNGCIYNNNYQRLKVERKIIPVEDLVMLLFHKILGFKLAQRPEKTRWIFYFKFNNIECAFADQKFGLSLYIDKEYYSEDNYLLIIKKVNKALGIFEKQYLSNYAKEKMRIGDVAAKNHFTKLSNMYHYFRDNAERCFYPKEQTATQDQDFDIATFANRVNQEFSTKFQAFYNAFSMIEAYFSRMEHFFMLCVAFDMKEDANVTEFCKKDWSEKFKLLFPLKEKKHKLLFDYICFVKDRYRNCFSHGMFSKNGEPFSFSFDGVCMLPVSLGEFKNEPHFNFAYVEDVDFKKICDIFDEFDDWLKNTSKVYEWEYAESGLAVYFDKKFKEKVKKQMCDIDTFRSFIMMESNHHDMLTNVDY